MDALDALPPPTKDQLCAVRNALADLDAVIDERPDDDYLDVRFIAACFQFAKVAQCTGLLSALVDSLNLAIEG